MILDRDDTVVKTTFDVDTPSRFDTNRIADRDFCRRISASTIEVVFRIFRA